MSSIRLRSGAATDTGDTDLFRKKASFIQHSLPGLAAGEYQIDVGQSLSQSGKDITMGGLPTLTRRFGVSGPRFSLGQNAIHSVFPPPNSAGEFSDSFAHVVLETDTLPWQRSPYLPQNAPQIEVRKYTTPVDGAQETVEYDDDAPSWLAVLVVSPSDFGGQNPAQFVTQGTVLDLVPSALTAADGTNTPVAGNLPSTAYSLFSHLIGTQTTPVGAGVGQSIGDALRFIDLPCPLFDALAPSLQDLEMMAHVRAVEMDSKPLSPGQTVNATEQYAVVLGSRLPESLTIGASVSTTPPPGKNLALLVSLEAMQSALRGHDPGSDYAAGVQKLSNGCVRLPVLYSWEFVSRQDTSFAFETFFESLNGRDPNGAGVLPNPQFRLPPPTFSGSTTVDSVAQDMLESGYLPMNHLTRVAAGGVSPQTSAAQAQTVSWWRGPLVPIGAFSPDLSGLVGGGTPQVFTPDALLRFDPRVGMYDVSCAAAWQMGRMLALQHPDFSATQYRWKKQAAVRYRMATERQGLSPKYAELSGAGSGTTGQSLRESVLRRLVPRPAPPALPEAEAPAPEDFPPLLPVWLAQLQTLQGVPFSCLVADESLLPLETLRFFQLDPAWMRSLQDGAMSIGRHYTAQKSAPSLVAEQIHGERLRGAARAMVPQIRRKLFKKPVNEAPAAPDLVTGFILRSQAVSAWKSTDVLGYQQGSSPYDYEQNKIAPDAVQSTPWLRLERLGADVLIGLFPGALYELVFHQPPEAIHFGFAAVNLGANSVTKTLRTPTLGWDDSSTSYDNQAHAGLTLGNVFVDATTRVVGLYGLSQTIGSTLAGFAPVNGQSSLAPGYYAPSPDANHQDHLVSSDFALEMVQGVGLVSFINGGQ